MARQGLPAGLLTLALTLAACSPGGPPDGGEFYPLSAAGVTYTVPAGWQVVDPVRDHGHIESITGGQSWGFNLIFVQRNLAVATFSPEPGTVIVVACQGPWNDYDGVNRNPLYHQAGEYWDDSWWNGVLADEKLTGTVTLASGHDLLFRQVRILPGLLAGDDIAFALARGIVEDRFLVLASGQAWARLEDKSELAGHIETLAANLRLEGKKAPSRLRDPG